MKRETNKNIQDTRNKKKDAGYRMKKDRKSEAGKNK